MPTRVGIAGSALIAAAVGRYRQAFGARAPKRDFYVPRRCTEGAPATATRRSTIVTQLRNMLCGFVIAVTPALADDGTKVVGTWQLASFWHEFQDGSEPRPMYGKNPTGYIVFTADGRMMSIVEAEGRKAPQSDEDRAAAFRSLIAYTGRYRFEGDKFITKVDVSWNPAWVGTEQARSFKLDGDRLQVISPWVMSPNLGKMTRATVTWDRVK